MTKALMGVIPTLLILSACGGAEAPAQEEGAVEDAPAESEFDQQLGDAEANAALDALDAEEAAETE